MTPGNISPPGDKENQPIMPEMTAISKVNAIDPADFPQRDLRNVWHIA